METKTGDAGFTRSPTLASSWDAANGALTQSLLLTRAGLGAQNFDWEELLAPPAPGCARREGTEVLSAVTATLPGSRDWGLGC